MEGKNGGIAFAMVIITLITLLLIGVMLVYYYLMPVKIEEQKGINLTNETVSSYLENHQLVKSLPKDSDIQISFGNEEYIIKNGEVVNSNEGNSSKRELEVSLPEDYIQKIGEEGLCQAMREAIDNGEYELKTNLSKKELLWKYKNSLRYRECFVS